MKFMNNLRRRGRKYYQYISVTRTKKKPYFWAEKFEKSDKILVIACGALANEITVLSRMNNWNHLQLRYLPAKLHNEPHKIPQNIRKNIINAPNIINSMCAIVSVDIAEPVITEPKLFNKMGSSIIKPAPKKAPETEPNPPITTINNISKDLIISKA